MSVDVRFGGLRGPSSVEVGVAHEIVAQGDVEAIQHAMDVLDGHKVDHTMLVCLGNTATLIVGRLEDSTRVERDALAQDPELTQLDPKATVMVPHDTGARQLGAA